MGALLQGPPFILTTADRVLQEGDSISALDTNTQMPMLIKRRFFQRARAKRTGPQPFWYNGAVSSTGLAASLSRITTANTGSLVKYAPTKFIAVYGTADIILGTTIGTPSDTTNATVLGSFKLIMDAICGNGIPAYIATVSLVGEKWPSGQNALDANIDTLVSGMLIIAARYGLCTIRDMRFANYTVQEPALNLPAPGVSLGPETRPDGVFAHFNPGGRGVCDSIVNADIQIQDAVAYVPTFTLSAPPQADSLGLDYDANALLGVDGNPGVIDGSNVTTWVNRGKLPNASWDLTITPGTKPVFRKIATAGKMNNSSAVQATANTSMQSTATATVLPQPIMSALIFQSLSLTGNQILVDGSVANNIDLPVLNGGPLQPAAPTALNPVPQPTVSASTWNIWIQLYDGPRSYTVLNGSQTSFGNPGTNGRDRMFMFASASGGILPFNGYILRFMEWHSALGRLPDWRDVMAYFRAKYGITPQ